MLEENVKSTLFLRINFSWRTISCHFPVKSISHTIIAITPIHIPRGRSSKFPNFRIISKPLDFTKKSKSNYFWRTKFSTKSDSYHFQINPLSNKITEKMWKISNKISCMCQVKPQNSKFMGLLMSDAPWTLEPFSLRKTEQFHVFKKTKNNALNSSQNSTKLLQIPKKSVPN